MIFDLTLETGSCGIYGDRREVSLEALARLKNR